MTAACSAISEATFYAMTHTLLSRYVIQIVRTHKLSYSAQFDLEKPIKIRIATLMKCTCTNGTEVQGEEADRVYTPDLTGKHKSSASHLLKDAS